MRNPTESETSEWVAGASKKELVAFLQECGSDALLQSINLVREPLSKGQVRWRWCALQQQVPAILNNICRGACSLRLPLRTPPSPLSSHAWCR